MRSQMETDMKEAYRSLTQTEVIDEEKYKQTLEQYTVERKKRTQLFLSDLNTKHMRYLETFLAKR